MVDWCYSTLSGAWKREDTSRRPNKQITPQSLNESSKITYLFQDSSAIPGDRPRHNL